MIAETTSELLLASLVSMAAGIAALMLPYRWNPFRLKGSFAKFLSEKANLKLPKIAGVIFIVLALLCVVQATFRGD